MPSNYVIIGGAAYQPGSAAAKKAQELYNQWQANQPKPATSSSIFTPPSGAAPSSFPSYAPSATAGSIGGSTLPGAATLAPGPATAGKGAFGLVPSTPNPISTAAGSIAGNQANLPALTNLATDTTKLSAGLAQLPYQLNLPNYMGNLGQAAANVSSNLAGVISPSTSNAITRAAAERGVRMGAAPGSPNAQTNWLGVLGQTSEQLQALGGNQLNQMIAATPTGQPFNVAGQQTTPGDVQYWQDVSNVRGAAPDPTQAAFANLDMLLKSIEAGKVAGFPGYGGGGGGGVPRMAPSAPGGVGAYSFPGYYYPGTARTGGGYYSAPTAPGAVPPPKSGYYYQQPGQSGDVMTGVGPDWTGVPGFIGEPSPAYDSGGIYQFGYGYGGGSGQPEPINWPGMDLSQPDFSLYPGEIRNPVYLPEYQQPDFSLYPGESR